MYLDEPQLLPALRPERVEKLQDANLAFLVCGRRNAHQFGACAGQFDAILVARPQPDIESGYASFHGAANLSRQRLDSCRRAFLLG